MNVVPHVAAKIRSSAIDARTTRHAGYRASQIVRIEEAFGWAKAAAGFARARHRGLARVGWQFTLAIAAYDLIRLPKLPVFDLMSERLRGGLRLHHTSLPPHACPDGSAARRPRHAASFFLSLLVLLCHKM